MMRSFLVLEDFADTREWLVDRLREVFTQTDISEASTIAQAKHHLEQSAFDLALVDLNLPDGKGADFIKHLGVEAPETYCVVVTAFDDDDHLFPALKAGARGYLLKNQTAEEFAESLRGIVHGQPAISTAIARRLISHFHQPDQPPTEDLSGRESEVLSLSAKGYTRNEISGLLDISPNTVASHLKSIYSKLNVNSRAEATLQALKLGLVT